MDFIDKEIFDLKREEKKAQHRDLTTGIYIHDRLVEFSRLEIPDFGFSIMQPEDFINMPVSIAKIKYPAENRPQLIRTSLDTTVNFTFSILAEDVSNDKVKSVAEKMRDVIRHVNPANIFYDIQEEVIEDTSLCWFNYKTYAIDEQLYIIMFITSIYNGKLLHGMFNCKFSEMNEWHDAAVQVITSIQKLSEQEAHKNEGINSKN